MSAVPAGEVVHPFFRSSPATFSRTRAHGSERPDRPAIRPCTRPSFAVLANVSLGRKGWGVAFVWMLLFWIGDMTCLAVGFLAVGAACRGKAC